jgi:hypothetical protein
MSFAGYMLQRGNSKTLFVIFAGSYALAALCWLAIDATRPLAPSQPKAPFSITL